MSELYKQLIFDHETRYMSLDALTSKYTITECLIFNKNW